MHTQGNVHKKYKHTKKKCTKKNVKKKGINIDVTDIDQRGTGDASYDYVFREQCFPNLHNRADEQCNLYANQCVGQVSNKLCYR